MKFLNTILLICLFAFSTVAADDAPNFELPNLQNEQVELAELLKQGPVVLDFWATWCKPCIKAFPKLDSLHQKYKEQGLTIVGINVDAPRNQAKVKPFVKSMGVEFLILLDTENEVMRRYQVQNLPTTLLIAPDGSIAARHIGFSSERIAELEREIKDMLKERQSRKE